MVFAFDLFVDHQGEVGYFTVANGFEFRVGGKVANCCDLEHDPKNW
jgi:hypothetical protein